MKETRNDHEILLEEPEGMRPFWGTCEDNIKIDLQEMECKNVE